MHHHLAEQLFRAEFFVSKENDIRQLQLAFDKINQRDAGSVCRGHGPDPNVLKIAGGIQIGDVLIDGARIVGLSFLDVDIRPDQTLAHRRGADVGYHNLADNRLGL